MGPHDLYIVYNLKSTAILLEVLLPNYISLRLTISVAANGGDGGEAILASGLFDNTVTASISFLNDSEDKHSTPSD